MTFFIQLLCLFFLTLQGCGKKEPPPADSGKIKVLSTIAMITDLVKEVGGEHVETVTLIQGELDPHTYELVKGDDEKFGQATLVFHNGLGLEHGLSLRKLLEAQKGAIAIGERIRQKDEKAVVEIDGQVDPHIWMDISLWAKGVPAIVEALCEKDPAHAENFRGNGKVLIEKLQAADHEAYERLQKIPAEKRYLITTHNAFNYFTRRYLAHEGEGEAWSARVTAPEGLAPDAEISLADLKLIVDYVRKYQVGVLFPESNLNRDALKKIVSASTEMGKPIRLSSKPIYGDAMGEGSYLNMMRHNVEVIASELEKS